MIETLTASWETLQTDETRSVQAALHEAGFERADAYRYNSASILVRVIDPQFEGLSVEKRHDLIEPALEQLPERTQGDILMLYAFAPSELYDPQRQGPQIPSAWKQYLRNSEFEDPTQSVL